MRITMGKPARGLNSLFRATALVWALATLPGGGAAPALGAEPAAPVPVQVKEVVLVRSSPAVLLTGPEEARYVLVFVDYFMASAIQSGLKGQTFERPLTHDLIGILLGRLGATVQRVTLTELRGSTYYALLSLEVNGARLDLDVRPSDALAIAVRLRAPIFANPALLHAFGPEGLPQEAPEAAPPDSEPPQDAPAAPARGGA